MAIEQRTPQETWKPVPGFLYDVSDLGRVRSLRRTFTHVRAGKECVIGTGGRIIKAWVSQSGGCGGSKYMRVGLSRNGTRYVFRVHRLVLLAFIGPCRDGMEGCHNDGDSLNNTLANLRWDTRKANMDDAARHGTKVNPKPRYGMDHPMTSLSDNEVAIIRRVPYVRGVYTQLARQYKCSVQTIWDIKNNRTRLPHSEEGDVKITPSGR